MRQVRLSEASAAWDEAVDLADRGDLRGAAIRLFRAAEELEAQSAAGDSGARRRRRCGRRRRPSTSAPYDATTRKRMRREGFRSRRGR